jgi:hypothetical protein
MVWVFLPGSRIPVVPTICPDGTDSVAGPFWHGISTHSYGCPQRSPTRCSAGWLFLNGLILNRSHNGSRQLNLQHHSSAYDAPLTLRAPLEFDLFRRKHIEKSFFLTHEVGSPSPTLSHNVLLTTEYTLKSLIRDHSIHRLHILVLFGSFYHLPGGEGTTWLHWYIPKPFHKPLGMAQ